MENHYEIELTKGYVTIVDADLPEDLQWIFTVSWYAHQSRNAVYARRKTSKGGKQFGQFLHRILARTPRHLQTDHKNGDHLDNRRDNLKNVTQPTNIKNCWRRRKHDAS